MNLTKRWMLSSPKALSVSSMTSLTSVLKRRSLENSYVSLCDSAKEYQPLPTSLKEDCVEDKERSEAVFVLGY